MNQQQQVPRKATTADFMGCALVMAVMTATAILGIATLSTWGWLALLGETALVTGGIVGVWVLYFRKVQRPKWLKSRIGELEAAHGIPLPREGRCRKCGSPLISGADFCSYCGLTTHPDSAQCPKCKTRIPDAGQFCPHCGTAISQFGK